MHPCCWCSSGTHRCLVLCFVPVAHCMVLHRLYPTEGLSLHCRTPPCHCCAPLGLEHSKVHRPMWISGEPDCFPLVGSVFPMGRDLVSAASSLQFPLWGPLLAGSLLSQTLLRTLEVWSRVPSSSLLGHCLQLEEGHHGQGLLPLPTLSLLFSSAGCSTCIPSAELRSTGTGKCPFSSLPSPPISSRALRKG